MESTEPGRHRMASVHGTEARRARGAPTPTKLLPPTTTRRFRNTGVREPAGPDPHHHTSTPQAHPTAYEPCIARMLCRMPVVWARAGVSRKQRQSQRPCSTSAAIHEWIGVPFFYSLPFFVSFTPPACCCAACLHAACAFFICSSCLSFHSNIYTSRSLFPLCLFHGFTLFRSIDRSMLQAFKTCHVRKDRFPGELVVDACAAHCIALCSSYFCRRRLVAY